MKRKGISLIVLIITIVVIIILGTAIVVNIAKANVINNANEAVLKSDVANLKSELEIYVTDQFVSNKGKYDRQNLNADVGQAKYNEENIEDKNKDGKTNIYDILSSLKNSSLDEAVYIQEGKIVFISSKFNSSQLKVLSKMGEEIDGTPKITDIESKSDFTSITVSADVTNPEEVEKYIYRLNDGEEIESTESTKTFEGLEPATKYTVTIKAVLKDGTEIEMVEEIETKEEELLFLNNNVLSYNFSNISKNTTEKVPITPEKIIDIENTNNFLTLNKVEYKNKSLIFNGSNSYATINLQNTPTLPLTVELEVSMPSYKESVIYWEPSSKTAIGLYDNCFMCTIGSGAYFKKIPDNFFDGTKKHIVITYTTLSNFELYVDGVKMSNSSQKNYYTANDSIAKLGSKNNASYFKGSIYKLKIYEGNITETEVLSLYNKTNIDNKLLANFDIGLVNEEELEYELEFKELVDFTKNNRNGIGYNVKYNDDKKGAEFNGTSSYMELTLDKELTLPLSVETVISMEEYKSGVIYWEPSSKTAIGLYDNCFMCTIGSDAYFKKIPDNFFDGTKKHIVISYTTLSNFELYVDGIKMSNSVKHNYYTGNDSIAKLGSKNNGNYLQGIIYKINIFNRTFNQDEVNELYSKSN